MTTDHISAIHLEPGEYPITNPIISNQEAFDIEPTIYGDAEKNYIIAINAAVANTSGSMILTTNRRHYHFVLISTPNFATQIVKFNWPRKINFALPQNNPAIEKSPETPKEEARVRPSFERTVLVEELKWQYATEISCEHDHECTKRQAAQAKELIPTNIFDDGEFTYFRWNKPPKTFPILFSVTPEGEHKIMNYSVKDNYYVANSIFEKAVLMLNEHVFVLVENINFGGDNGG